jgi:hypothetical protein
MTQKEFKTGDTIYWILGEKDPEPEIQKGIIEYLDTDKSGTQIKRVMIDAKEGTHIINAKFLFKDLDKAKYRICKIHLERIRKITNKRIS